MKKSTLRSTLVKEINEIGAGLREQTIPRQQNRSYANPNFPMLSNQHPFHALMLSVFNEVYRNNHSSMWAKDFNAFASFFSLPRLADTARYVSNPDSYTLQITSLAADDAEVVIGIAHTVTHEIPGGEEPVMEWITVDPDTKVRRPATDGSGKPLMKKTKSKEEQEKCSFEYHFPLDFFVDLFKEIGRESILSVPDDYIPAPLGVDISRFLYGMGMDIPMMVSRGGWDHPHMTMHPMLKMRSGRIDPVRIFLKPEKGTDRMEVIVEPYPPEQIKAHRELTQRREGWVHLRVHDTQTLKAFLKAIPRAPAEQPSMVAG